MTTPQLLVLTGLAAAYVTLFFAGYLRQPTLADKEAYTMNWLHFAQSILPLVINFVPGIPPGVATSVVQTMIAVESMPGKTGAEKKAIVMDNAVTQLQNINVIAGKQVVNVEATADAIDKGVDAGVAAVKAVQQHATVVAAQVVPAPPAA